MVPSKAAGVQEENAVDASCVLSRRKGRVVHSL